MNLTDFFWRKKEEVIPSALPSDLYAVYGSVIEQSFQVAKYKGALKALSKIWVSRWYSVVPGLCHILISYERRFNFQNPDQLELSSAS